MKKVHVIALALYAACGGGYADESLINLVYSPGQNSEATPLSQGRCKVIVESLLDGRKNKQTLGTTFRDNPIISRTPMSDWLQAAIGELRGRGIEPVFLNNGRAGTSDADVSLQLALDKLYIWNHSLNMNATLVATAALVSRHGVSQVKTYRVVGTKLNWANGDGEFVDALNLAADRLTEQVGEAVAAMCKQASLAS